MKIAIVTASLDKIAGITKSISRFFHLENQEIQLYCQAVASGVSEQPFDFETYQGALNRATGIQETFPGMDFYVSCEAGIESIFGQYFNVQVVCILPSSGIPLWCKSSGWVLPSEDIEEIRENNLDTYLRRKGISCIEELLGPSCSRSAAAAEAPGLH